MLKMMGHSGAVPSAILVNGIPAALSRLTAAINATKASMPDNDMEEQAVSMANRALLLVALLDAAAKAKKMSCGNRIPPPV